MNKEERNKKILAGVIVIAVLVLGIYKLFFEQKAIEEEIIDIDTISDVTDNSRFYTVSSCVSKYISYLTNSQTDELLILLSNDYKTKNSIDSSNLYDFLGTLTNFSTFEPKKMKVQRMSKNIYKYYVKGYMREETMDEAGLRKDYYMIVILDEKDMTFAIEPYDGSIFK